MRGNAHENRIPGSTVFVNYCAIKLHFQPSSSYDAVTNNYKLGFSGANTLSKRKDKAFFVKLGERFRDIKELRQFLVSNFIYGKKASNIWIGDLLDDTATNVYRRHMSLFETLSYEFQKDMQFLKDQMFIHDMDNPDELFTTSRKQQEYPWIIDSILMGKVRPESFILMNSVFNGCLSGINKTILQEDKLNIPDISKDLVWKPLHHKLDAYSRIIPDVFGDFLPPKENIKKILKGVFFPQIL